MYVFRLLLDVQKSTLVSHGEDEQRIRALFPFWAMLLCLLPLARPVSHHLPLPNYFQHQSLNRLFCPFDCHGALKPHPRYRVVSDLDTRRRPLQRTRYARDSRPLDSDIRQMPHR